MSKKPKLARTSQKAIAVSGYGDEAWWYENTRTIDVCIRKDGQTMMCRIRRAGLADWIKRTER